MTRHGLAAMLDRKGGLQAFVSAPFWVKGEMPGALHVGRRARLPFTPRERQLLSSVAAQTGIMLTNRHLLRETSQAEALRQLNQMKSEFALRASHELRTPATAIKGYIETLLRPDMALDRREEKRLLEDMNEVSNRLNRLIQEVLNVAHIESGALGVRKERVESEEGKGFTIPAVCASQGPILRRGRASAVAGQGRRR